MINLKDNKISYIIVGASLDKFDYLTNNKLNESLLSNLYLLEYTVFNLSTYKLGVYGKAFLAINSADNDELRNEAISLMDRYSQDYVIIKYKGEIEPKKILSNGSEVLLDINIYDSNEKNLNYIYNGVSFSFNDKKRYFHPKEKKDIKNGMIVEYFNNNVWIEKIVGNIDTEWENMYKLLTKYNKLRISC